MKIAIIGAGKVGGTLGKRWAANGHGVVFASREPGSDKMRSLVAEAGPTASSALAVEAGRAGEVLVVATPWQATEEILRSCGDLSGKVVIDTTNAPLPGLNGLATGTNSSAGEQVAIWAAGARVVKAFNTVGYNIMADPKFDAGRVAMFFCGDDAAAKTIVKGLIEELGFEALDAGALAQARLLEPFALLWMTLAMKYGYTREIGFQLLRR